MSMEQYKTKLQAALTQIETDLSSIAIKDETTGDWVTRPDTSELGESDENYEADAVEETSARDATVAELETTYRNIVRALENIDAGTYGTCEICAAPIESDRLDFAPAARTCKAHRDDERTLAL